MQLSADAIQTYAHVARSGMLSSVALESLFAQGAEVALMPKPWAHVKDPVAALLLTCGRIDIRFEGPWKILEPSGLVWDVRDVSPGFLAERARLAARATSDRQALSRIGPSRSWEASVFWRPLNELLYRRPSHDDGDDGGDGGAVGGDGWGVREQCSLRGLVIGSHCCQHRLSQHDADLSEDCLLCGSRGTLFHRHFDCPARAGWRRDSIPPEVAQAASFLARGPLLLQERFVRGLLPDPGQVFARKP